MSTPHYVVFVGASSMLSDRLNALKSRDSGMRLIAPAAKASHRGITSRSIQQALDGLMRAMPSDMRTEETARLSIWAYTPASPTTFAELWNAFGRAAWIEFVPIDLRDKEDKTRVYIEERIKSIKPLLHEISYFVFNKRRSSPLPLPFVNFKSDLLTPYRGHWYSQMDLDNLKRTLGSITSRFRQAHGGRNSKHWDDRKLIFDAALPTVCHGVPHPTGDANICYVSGRFRFGAALYPGHHYDVSQARGNLDCVLYDCDGRERRMAPERRRHINIFSNDYLLPVRT